MEDDYYEPEGDTEPTHGAASHADPITDEPYDPIYEDITRGIPPVLARKYHSGDTARFYC